MVNFLTELTENGNEKDEPPSLSEEDVSGNVQYLDDYVREVESDPKRDYQHLVLSPTPLELFLDVLTSMDESYLTNLLNDSEEREYSYIPLDGITYSATEKEEESSDDVEKDYADYIISYEIQNATLGDNPLEFQFEDGDDCTRKARLYLVELQTLAMLYNQKMKAN